MAPRDSRLRCGLHYPDAWTDAATVRPFTLPSYHSELEYGIVNSIILNMFELWLYSNSICATFKSHSTLAQRSG